MPKKLQIKLLSQSAELLSMTNCSAGQISVLRAESQSELRPYQRALAGTHGRERFIIMVDGKEYSTEHHNLIGFGEVAPHSGLTVGQYLASAGVIEGAVSGLLMAFGIEGIETKFCSSLSPDEERKVRIFAATADPDKALVLNEPFEPIISNWRDRIAEFLTDFARTKNGLVVVASLSYRPESWIDNPVIARHQVGQSLRRTIGFGAVGSDSNQLINQLRDQIRSEESQVISPPPPVEQQPQRPQASAMSLGAAAMMGSVDTEATTESEEFEPSLMEDIELPNSGRGAALKAGAVIGAGGLGVFAALALLGIYPSKDGSSPESRQTAVAVHEQQQSQGQNQVGGDHPHHSVSGDVAKQVAAPEKSKVAYILDRYPELIRVSVLDTSRGVMGETSLGLPVEAPPVEIQKSNDQSGNFYKLLERAGTDKADPPSSADTGSEQPDYGAWNQPESPETNEYNPGEEEERREAIRQKFLEAIRAAAERREQEGFE
jgi:hypothetical protein